MRYDIFVAKKLNISRNKANELINSKSVLLNDKTFKVSFDVKNYLLSLDKEQSLLDENEILNSNLLKLKLLNEVFVSRAAFKLKSFLEKNQINIKGKTCLDIGSSTGGFVQVLLEYGALSVVGVDVGSNQLHGSLKNEKRLTFFENMDFRDFKSESEFDLITCDISFISLSKILYHVDKIGFKELILLFKPQFEVGIEAKRDAKGVLKDEKAVLKARASFERECLAFGWILKLSERCEFKGKEGNSEYFYYFTKA